MTSSGTTAESARSIACQIGLEVAFEPVPFGRVLVIALPCEDMRVYYKKGIDNLDNVIEAASHMIENIEMLFMGSIYDLAKFDEQDFVDEYLSECYAEAYDENLDYYVDKAMSAAAAAFAEFAENAKDEADVLLRQIGELETLAKKVLRLVLVYK